MGFDESQGPFEDHTQQRLTNKFSYIQQQREEEEIEEEISTHETPAMPLNNKGLDSNQHVPVFRGTDDDAVNSPLRHKRDS